MSSGNSIFATESRRALIALLFLALAMVLGGGGTPNPLNEVRLELLAALATLAWLWIARRSGPAFPTDRLVVAAGLLAVLLPALQLVPLPPGAWHALPGRETERAALALVGAEDDWQPFTISAPRTLASLLAFGPPLLLLAMTASLAHRGRRWLVLTIAAVAFASAVLGAIQLAGGAAAPRLYAASHNFVVTGFQANRNAAADVLLIGIVALALVPRPSRQAASQERTLLLGGGIIVLGTAAVLTGSRAGIALLPIALIAHWLILRVRNAGGSKTRWLPLLAGTMAVASAALFALRNNTALRAVAARFDFSGDARTELWSDTLYAIGQFWPFGSGIGTFVPAFIAVEPLEAVDPTRPNRAHNDFLELALEAGLPGLLVLLAIIVLLALAAWRAWRDRPDDRGQVLFAVSLLVIVGLHSVVDYPLRSMAIACLAAVAAGLLAAPPVRSAKGKSAIPVTEQGDQ